MSSLEIIKEEFEKYKGQLVINDFEVLRFIGLCEDSNDYYYCLYNGKSLKLRVILTRLTPLKGFINDKDYDGLVRLSKLNDLDQQTLYGNTIYDLSDDIKDHIKEITSKWAEDIKVIGELFWHDIN